MDFEQRIIAFATLGKKIKAMPGAELEELALRAASKNNWFTRENVRLAMDGLIRYLEEEKLRSWLSSYELPDRDPKVVGVVMAGNIPLVGFHDFLAVLMSGNILLAKLSSQDPYLLPFIANDLIAIEPAFAERINFVDRLAGMDAVIATGSDNSARYFKFYFGKNPHIIRQNRSSCAILNGDENAADFSGLGKDVFQYYGLGCRNVSKIFVPNGYHFNELLDNLAPFHTIIEHNKYQNNYDYNKSIYLVNRVHHFDNGFLLLTEDKALVSPISVLFFEYYESVPDLTEKLDRQQTKIQVTTSKDGWFPGSIPLGKAQQPELWDYADGVNTMLFLTSI